MMPADIEAQFDARLEIDQKLIGKSSRMREIYKLQEDIADFKPPMAVRF